MTVNAYLSELESAGVAVGAFNQPDWEASREGSECCLDSLFDLTPPTALMLDEPFLYNTAFHYLARKGLRVPQDISMVCTDTEPSFDWCLPTIAHIYWDYRPVLRRIQRWVNNVAHGHGDRRQSFVKAKFLEGGSIGPAPKKR